MFYIQIHISWKVYIFLWQFYIYIIYTLRTCVFSATNTNKYVVSIVDPIRSHQPSLGSGHHGQRCICLQKPVGCRDCQTPGLKAMVNQTTYKGPHYGMLKKKKRKTGNCYAFKVTNMLIFYSENIFENTLKNSIGHKGYTIWQ